MASDRRRVQERHHDTYEVSSGTWASSIVLPALAHEVSMKSMEIHTTYHWRVSITLGSYNVQIQLQPAIRSGVRISSTQNCRTTTAKMGRPYTCIRLENLVATLWKALVRCYISASLFRLWRRGLHLSLCRNRKRICWATQILIDIWDVSSVLQRRIE